MNQHNHCVMVLMPGATPHLWQYAHILKLFHVSTTFTDKDPKKKAVVTNVLWVQWVETDDTWAFGAEARCLERLQYIDKTSEDARAFLELDMVIHAFHMQPAFYYGLDPECHVYKNTNEGDYKYYFVNRLA
jgi:hypothetical protein